MGRDGSQVPGIFHDGTASGPVQPPSAWLSLSQCVNSECQPRHSSESHCFVKHMSALLSVMREDMPNEDITHKDKFRGLGVLLTKNKTPIHSIDNERKSLEVGCI